MSLKKGNRLVAGRTTYTAGTGISISGNTIGLNSLYQTKISNLENKEGNLDLNGYSSIENICSDMFSSINPIGYGRVGASQSSNLKNLIGNPSGFGNYTSVVARVIGSDSSEHMKFILFTARNIFGNQWAYGFMGGKTDYYYWSGWKVL